MAERTRPGFWRAARIAGDLKGLLVADDWIGFRRACVWALVASVVNAGMASATVPVTHCLSGQCPAVLGGVEGTSAYVVAAVVASVVVLLRFVTQLTLAWQTMLVNQAVQQRTITRLMDTYLHLPWPDYAERNQSHYLRRVMTTALDAAFVIRQYVTLVSGVTTLVLLGVVVVFTSSPAAIVVLLLVGGSGYLVLNRSSRMVRASSHEREEALRAWSMQVSEALGSFKEIRAHQRERLVLDRLEEPLERTARSNVLIGFRPSVPAPTFELFTGVAVMGVALVWLLTGRSLAELVPQLIFYAVTARLLQPALNSVLSTRAMIAGSIINVELIVEELALGDRRQELVRAAVSHDLPAGVHLRGVSFRYHDGPVVLADGDLEHRHPSWTAFVGPSGAGKSTVLELVCGLRTPDAGDLRIGWPAGSEPVICYVPQQVALLDGSLEENIVFGGEEADPRRFERAVAAAQLTELVADLSSGRGDRLGPNGTTLSGGQRQRLAIARALYREPDLLLLDESTSGLDEATELKVLTAIRRDYPGTSVLFVTHRPGTLGLADQVVEVAGGRFVDRTAGAERR